MKAYLLFILFLIGCGGNQTPHAPTIYAYGDSITAGNINGGYSYVNMISQALNYPLINKAVGGTTIAAQYNAIMADNWASNDIVIFTAGLNDAGYGMDPGHIAIYVQDLETILTKFATFGMRVYLGTPIMPLDQKVYSDAAVRYYAQINRTLVAEINAPNIILIDFNVGYKPTKATTIPGNGDVHPNTTGYELMTQYFFFSID